MDSREHNALGHHPGYKHAILDRVQRMVERDKNHPSVIIWSTGNEIGVGDNMVAAYNWVKQRDPSRPVQLELGPDIPENNFIKERYTDIIPWMYRTIPVIKEKYIGKYPDRPFIWCEYSHGMNNSTGNLKELWEFVESERQLQGGFIWDWVDQGLLKTNKNGERYWGYGGDFEPDSVHNDGVGMINGLVFPDRSIHPALEEVKQVYQYVNIKAKNARKGIFEITNNYFFTNLEDFQIKWILESNGIALKNGMLNGMRLGPGKTKKIRIKDFREMHNSGENHIRFSVTCKDDTGLLKAGYEVAKAQFRHPDSEYSILIPVNSFLSSPIKSELNDSQLILFLDKGKLEFDLEQGRLSKFSFGGLDLFHEGPKPNFWRAPVDNDYGNKMPELCQGWKKASSTQKLKTFSIEFDTLSNSAHLVFIHNLPHVTSQYITEYKVFGTGIIDVSGSIKIGSNELPELPRFGMTLTLPVEYDNMAWFGRGPHENYCDRNTSAFVGLYEGKVTDQYVPYIRPQENGNKTDVRWVSLTNNSGAGIKILGDIPLSVNAHHNSIEDFDWDRAIYRRHTTDIKKRDFVRVNIDLKQRGVAGDDSWGALPTSHTGYSRRIFPILTG